jgi:hypothetical protein
MRRVRGDPKRSRKCLVSTLEAQRAGFLGLPRANGDSTNSPGSVSGQAGAGKPLGSRETRLALLPPSAFRQVMRAGCKPSMQYGGGSALYGARAKDYGSTMLINIWQGSIRLSKSNRLSGLSTLVK